jgi:FlaA1/EpsC-like NDP-sugar epimerase
MIYFAVDAATWVALIPVANGIRRDFDVSEMFVGKWFLAITLAVAAQAISGYVWGTYRRRWRYGSFEEALSGAAVVLTAGFIVTLVSVVRGSTFLPASVAFMSTVFVMTVGVAMRSLWRLNRQSAARPRSATPIIVIGAGDGAYQLTRQLLHSPHSTYLPVAFVDDDPLKSHFRMQSVRVEGKIADLISVAQRYNVTKALLAIPSASYQLVQDVKMICDASDLKLLILPSVAELFGAPTASDIRPIAAADFLGRLPGEVDTAEIAQYITGRRVLVTGAGGSIGSELCRQLTLFNPSELMMLDRDENGLHAVVCEGVGLSGLRRGRTGGGRGCSLTERDCWNSCRPSRPWRWIALN